MNNQELVNKIDQLPSHLIDKKVVISKDSVLELVRGLNEPKKVKIPRFVADYLEQQKQRGEKLFDALFAAGNETTQDWLNMNNNEEIFARAWLDGYEVEQDKRCTVKIKQTDQYLDTRYIGDGYIFVDTKYPPVFTKQELEQAGFGGVFGNSMFEVEEVE